MAFEDWRTYEGSSKKELERAEVKIRILEIKLKDANKALMYYKNLLESHKVSDDEIIKEFNMKTYSKQELLHLLETPRVVTFKKKTNGELRQLSSATIGNSFNNLPAPEQNDAVHGLITVSCSDGYRSFYADSVVDVE